MNATQEYFEKVKDQENVKELMKEYLKIKPTKRWIDSVPFSDILAEKILIDAHQSKLSSTQRRYVLERAKRGQ